VKPLLSIELLRKIKIFFLVCFFSFNFLTGCNYEKSLPDDYFETGSFAPHHDEPPEGIYCFQHYYNSVNQKPSLEEKYCKFYILADAGNYEKPRRETFRGINGIIQVYNKGYSKALSVIVNIIDTYLPKSKEKKKTINQISKMGAMAGDCSSIEMLVYNYAFNQNGYTENFVRAYMWIIIGLSRCEKTIGFYNAKDALKNLGITGEQIATAQRLASEWKPKRYNNLHFKVTYKNAKGRITINDKTVWGGNLETVLDNITEYKPIFDARGY